MREEQVLAIPTSHLETILAGHSHDLVPFDEPHLEKLIRAFATFIPRSVAEVSPQYRQIIPYVLIRRGSQYFVLERTAKQTEARLHHKVSLGIGGHINPDAPELRSGLQKELEEEVSINGSFRLAFTGLLNDESTDVGRVHLGAVYVLEAEGDVIVRETEKMTGRWEESEVLADLRPRMESWSQIAYDRLIAGPAAGR